MTHSVLFPLPDRGFDITETAVPWKILSDAGLRVVFATEAGGSTPEADPTLFGGPLFGTLGAKPEPIAWYREMETAPAFQTPISWKGLKAQDYAGLFLPGGHAPGMKPYLESVELQQLAARFVRQDRPVAAICHGVLVLARAVDDQGPLLAGRKCTCLPRYMERSAWWLTRWQMGDHYRTYPAWVQDEVEAATDGFQRGPISLVRRGTSDDHSAAFVVVDANLQTARWPGDAYLIAERFASICVGDPH